MLGHIAEQLANIYINLQIPSRQRITCLCSLIKMALIDADRFWLRINGDQDYLPLVNNNSTCPASD